jgi:hypothetical protein
MQNFEIERTMNETIIYRAGQWDNVWVRLGRGWSSPGDGQEQ